MLRSLSLLRSVLPTSSLKRLSSAAAGSGGNGEFSFDKESDETLESLCDRFESLVDDDSRLAKADVSLASGVLTVSMPDHGTYVINKQSPNRQIWLSSPKSGPARFDFDPTANHWIYRHTGKSLHELLDSEFGDILKGAKTDFQKCYLGGKKK